MNDICENRHGGNPESQAAFQRVAGSLPASLRAELYKASARGLFVYIGGGLLSLYLIIYGQWFAGFLLMGIGGVIGWLMIEEATDAVLEKRKDQPKPKTRLARAQSAKAKGMTRTVDEAWPVDGNGWPTEWRER